MNNTVFIDISCILWYHHHLIRVDSDISIQITLLWIQTIATKSSSCIIVNLKTIVQLFTIKALLTRNRIGHIKALKSTLLILIRLTRKSLVPIQVWFDRITVLVFCDHIAFITTVCRVSQTGTNNRITNPLHKLLVLGIGYLCFIHPESINRDILYRCLLAP